MDSPQRHKISPQRPSIGPVKHWIGLWPKIKKRPEKLQTGLENSQIDLEALKGTERPLINFIRPKIGPIRLLEILRNSAWTEFLPILQDFPGAAALLKLKQHETSKHRNITNIKNMETAVHMMPLGD